MLHRMTGHIWVNITLLTPSLPQQKFSVGFGLTTRNWEKSLWKTCPVLIKHARAVCLI